MLGLSPCQQYLSNIACLSADKAFVVFSVSSFWGLAHLFLIPTFQDSDHIDIENS